MSTTHHPSASQAALPLAGVRVLDLSRVLAGPLCTMMLGDLGAHVIKVERPDTGDDTRGWGPPFDESGQSAYFLAVNRNKLSVAADLADPGDQALLRSLIAKADVVIDNFLPGVLARFGLDAAPMLAAHPQLIWCTLSGFGEDSVRPGYDFVVQAESGWMAITGPEAGPPYKVGVALADVLAGKDAAVAILAALAARGPRVADGEDTPRALRPVAERPVAERRLHVALASSAAAALVNVAQNTLVTGADARRWGNAHPNLVPYQLFDSADRPLVVAVGTDAQWRRLAERLGLPQLAADPALATNAGRLAHREAVVTAVAAALAQQPAAHWLAVLDAAGVPCGLVRSVAEVVDAHGGAPAWGMPPASGGNVRLSPPALDAHGVAVRTRQWSAFDHVPILAGAE